MNFLDCRHPFKGFADRASGVQISDCAYIEFGAGKAYLASMLVEASDVRTLALVDSQSFRFKADRLVTSSSLSCVLHDSLQNVQLETFSS